MANKNLLKKINTVCSSVFIMFETNIFKFLVWVIIEGLEISKIFSWREDERKSVEEAILNFSSFLFQYFWRIVFL